MKKYLVYGLMAFCLIGQGAIAHAQDAPQPNDDRRAMMRERMKEHMAEMDTNHDGKIEKNEFMANAAKHFDKLDTNHDGVISPEERKAFHMAHKGWHHGHGGPGDGSNHVMRGPGPGPQGDAPDGFGSANGSNKGLGSVNPTP